MTDRPTAALVMIGNELLSGRTQDANLAYLGKRMGELGIRLVEARVIADDEAVIVGAVNELRAKVDYLFTSGGIGPTHDDITAGCVARAFGVKLKRDPEAVAILRRNYASDADMTEGRLKMCEVPEGAALIPNSVSRAPGFRIGNVHVMAGIPRIFQAMVEAVAPGLEGGRPVLSKTIVSRVPEGVIGAPLGALQKDFPDVEIGSYPFRTDAGPGANLVLRTPDPERLEAAAEAVRALVRAHGAEPEDGE
jgi:molybdopterin-biosynthesis enzyme MoeA-like protein